MRYEVKPLSFSELLDGGFKIYRDQFAAFITLCLVTELPSAVLGALINRSFLGTWYLKDAIQPGNIHPMFWPATGCTMIVSTLFWSIGWGSAGLGDR